MNSAHTARPDPYGALSRRSPVTRIAALLALVACAAALYLLVMTVTESDSTAGDGRTKSAQTQKQKADTPATYTVAEGDSLGLIAEKTGVPLTKIERLNKGIDAEALNAGQVLKLR